MKKLDEEEGAGMKNEKKILKWIILFFVGMMVLGIVSRAADSVTVPKVQVQSPSRDSLTFQLSGEGKLTADKEKIVFLPAGGKLVSFSAVGQQVKKGDTLAVFDTEDLKEKKKECEAEIEKQELAIQQETLSGIPAAQTREQDTAERTVSQINEKLQAAQEELKQLQEKYDVLLNTEQEKQEKEKQEQEKQEQEQEKQEQEKQKQEKDEQENAGSQDSSYEEEKAEMKAQVQAAQDKVDSLKESLQAAQDALSDAKKNDANTAENNERQKTLSDLSIESMQIDLKQKKEELKEIKELLSESGKIKASAAGTVLEAPLTTGMQTSGQEYLVIGTGSGRFTANVEAEDAAYLSKGDEVSLTPKGTQESLKGTIEEIQNITDTQDSDDSGQDSADLDEQVRMIVKLEKNNLVIGTAMSFKIVKESESSYDTVIPLAALREDSQGKYVLILREEETVLGTEWVTARVMVTILDKDDSNAAVDSALMSDDQIIIGSSKSIQEGDRVRVE